MLESLHPALRYGADLPFRVFTYPTHSVLYDCRLRLPVLIRGMVHGGTSSKDVDRKDEFHQDDTLSEFDLVTPGDYATHNRNTPDDKLDLGHGFGSQFRRQSAMQQHYIDAMTSIIPERKGMNRIAKNITEGHIVDLGSDPRTRCLYVTNGCGFLIDEKLEWMNCGTYKGLDPRYRRGSAIPSFSWTHVIQETATSIRMWGLVYRNTQEEPEVEVMSTEELSRLVGHQLANNIKSDRGVTERQRTRKPWWE